MNQPTTSAPAYRFLAEQFPQLGRAPVSVEPNISSEYFELERERIFKRCWLNVARVEDLPRPGDYLVQDIEILRTSVLLVHGEDGVIRAFHNACQHRGNKLVPGCGHGRARAFSCGFHGWTYDARGALVDVPDAVQFYDLDRPALGLRALACDVWEGFVFINHDPAPQWTLAQYLGPIGERYRGYPFHAMQMQNAMCAEVNANWKVVMDAFQEAFHVSFVHRDTVADGFTSRANPYSHIAWCDLGPMHRTASVYGVPELNRQIHPAEGLAFKHGVAFTQGDASGVGSLPGVNPAGIADWSFDINVLFPQFFVDPSNGFYFTMNFWPITVNRTRFEFRFHMFPAGKAGERVSQAYTHAIMRDAGLEDLGTVEHTQQMLESGAITHMQLGDQELLVRHSYAVADAFVRGEL